MKEVEDKDNKDIFFIINYMKLFVILWKSLQKEINEREHIEARFIELEDAVNKLKEKGKGKAKSKLKDKHIIIYNGKFIIKK